jgi:hypothetical protein
MVVDISSSQQHGRGRICSCFWFDVHIVLIYIRSVLQLCFLMSLLMGSHLGASR